MLLRGIGILPMISSNHGQDARATSLQNREAADLAVAKLHAGRPKNFEVLVHLLREGLLDAKVVRARLDGTPLREKDIVKLCAVWERVLQLANQAG